MLTGNAFINMLKKPEFNTQQSKPVEKRLVKPFKRTLAGVLNAVKNNQRANRRKIINITEYSDHCVDRCLDWLVDNGELTRSFVRMSGPYKVYSYTTLTRIFTDEAATN